MIPGTEAMYNPNFSIDKTETVLASANIGFAIATIKAFMEPPGVSSTNVHEAIRRLEEALVIVSAYENRSDSTRIHKE